jgi:hypothetical protein
MWETKNLNSLPFLPEGGSENSPGWNPGSAYPNNSLAVP